jgi:hypothetical protein
MSDYGRYGSQTRDRYFDDGGGRSRPRGGRRGESIFGSDWDRGGARGGERDRERSRSHRDNQPGGWFGDGRTSDYDRREDRDRERDRNRERARGGWSHDEEGRYARSGRYGYDDYHEGLPIEETSRLIASNKVEGTPVYGRDRHRLGTIYNFMVDKYEGRVEYAVMSYGGFLGIGQRYYPLPWRILTYHRDAGGFVIDMDERDLERAPSFDRGSEPEFDSAYGRHVHGWYGLQY